MPHRLPPARLATLAALAALLTACGGDSGPDDGGGDPTALEQQTTALFPAGAARDSADGLRRQLETTADPAAADSIAFALVEYTIGEFDAGRLAPPGAELPGRLDTYLTDVLAEAGVAVPGLEPAAFTPEGTVAVVRQAGGVFPVGTGRAGLEVPANAVTRPVLLFAYRLADSSAFAPGEGPLPTALPQWPLFYDFTLAPAVTLAEDGILGLCPMTEEGSAYTVGDDVLARLRIGQPDPDAPGTIELLERVEAPAWLVCDGVTTSVRAALLRRRPGIGGRVRRFSPKALVDVGEAPPPSGTVTPIGAFIPGAESGEQFGYDIALAANGTRLAAGAPFNGADVGRVRVYDWNGTAWTQVGADLVGEAAGDRFGISVDLNATGTRLVVGAYLNDGGGSAAGQVRVFELVGGAWVQMGPDIDGTTSSQLGWEVSMSDDGTRVVAGAPAANSVDGSARVFELAGGAWTQLGNTLAVRGVEFGGAVSISGDGRRVAVGGAASVSSSRPGSAFVYELAGGTWTQVGNTILGKALSDFGGSAVALSADGSRVLVSSPGNDEGGTSAGQVRLFQLAGGAWTQQGGDVNGVAGDALGGKLAMSADGTSFLATATSAAVSRLYRLAGGSWTKLADVPAFVAQGVAMSPDGRVIGSGAVREQTSTGRVTAYSVAP